MAKQRNIVFDAVKLFTVFMMLWGHSVAYLQEGEGQDNPIFIAFYSFRMPLFMTVCGFFSGSAMKLGFVDFLLKKGRQLLLPALAFWVPIGICVYIKSGIGNFLISLDISFWYLKCAFICFSLYYLASRAVKPLWAKFLLSLVAALFITPYSVDRMFPFFIFGVFLKDYYHFVKRRSGSIALFAGIVFLFLFFNFDNEIFTSMRFSCVRMAFANGEDWGYRLGCYFMAVLTGIAGSVFFISLFEYLSTLITAGRLGRKVASWGSETLGIYLLQTLFIELLPKYVGRIEGMDFMVYHFVVTPLYSALVLLVSIGIIRLMERSRWLSFLVLGRELRREAGGGSVGRVDAAGV